MQKTYENVLSCILFVILLTMVNNYNTNFSIVRYILYGIEFMLIGIMYNKAKLNGFKTFNNKFIICLLIITLGMILFEYDAFFSNLIKFIGYATCFSFGRATSKHQQLSPPKYVIAGLIMLPLFIVAIGDHTLNQSLFFPNSNCFTYWGLCCSILYYTSFHSQTKTLEISIIILLSYIAIGSSLGILAAVILSFIIINRKNRKLMTITIISCLLLMIGIQWIDISIFKRIRNVIDIYKSLSLQDWLNLTELNLYELQSANSVDDNIRSDNTSSIWRFQHWITLLYDYIENLEYSLFVGLGDNYAQFNHRLRPHNDWLRILIEYGAIVFFIVITWTRRFCQIVNRTKVYYMFLAVIIYHITENLIDSFPANCLMYICAGYWYQTLSKKSNVNSIQNKNNLTYI